MKIYSNTLEENLNSNFFGVYLFASNEPYWLSEATEMVLKKSTNNGFSLANRSNFSDANIDLVAFQEACTSPGLFADKIIVTLSIKSLKGKAAEALKLAAASLNSSLLLIITMPQISLGDLKTKLLAPLDSKGITVVFYPPTEREMMSFIDKKAAQNNLAFQQDAKILLYKTYEGNIYSLVQSMQKLKLCGYSGLIDLKTLEGNIDSDNHFSSYELVDSFIDPNVAVQKRLRILNSLKSEGIPVIDMIGKIGNAISSLYEMRKLLDSNQNLDTWFDNHPLLKVLKTKRQIYSRGASKTTQSQLNHLVNLICKADLLARSFNDDEAYLILREIAVAITFPQKCKLTEDD